MVVLITGANGFLGYYLVQLLLFKFRIIATGRGPCRLPFAHENFTYYELDFTDPFSVHDVFLKYQPDIIIHAGAIGKPDDCELNQWQAYLTNVEGTVTLLSNAAEWKSFFVFISTDFVFDGTKGNYTETDIPNPVNYYGRTKLEAEEAVQEYEYEWAIARTVLVYGKPNTGRENILTVLKDKLCKGEVYSVFDDQVRTPTYVEDLAAGVASIIEKKAKGIFHLSGVDVLTPFQMACMTADHLVLDKKLIRKVTSEDYQQPAKRPLNTKFIIDKAKRELGFRPLSFNEGLLKTFE